jgi:hypothetical protein
MEVASQANAKGYSILKDLAYIQRDIGESRNLLASVDAVELPAVITTLDGLAVESPFGKLYSPMRAVVPERERVSFAISPQDDFFSENFFGVKSFLFQFFAIQRKVPKFSQKQGRYRCPSSRGVTAFFLETATATAFIAKGKT